MLVEIEPVLIGQPFGLEGKDISRLILSTCYQGRALFPITKWPSHVYVTRILDDAVLEALSFVKEQVELIAWAMIFPALEESETYFEQFDGDGVA